MVRHLTLLLLIMKARITAQLTWNTEKLSHQCCQSKYQLLMWNFTEGENERILELQWFFNETTLICLDSKTIGFHVETSYNGRVERNGTAGLLLKNISSTDAGKYTLYVKLAEEKIRNVQHIFLAVEEQVPYHCEPIIDIQIQNVMRCSTTCNGRLQLSPEWIINGTQDPVSIGTHLRIDEGIYYKAFCCLRGLKCHDGDQFKLCKPNPIQSKVFMDDIHTVRQNEANTIKGDAMVTEAFYFPSNINVQIITAVIMITEIFVLILIVAYFLWRRHESPRSSHDSNSNQTVQTMNNINMDPDVFKHIIESAVRKGYTGASETTSDREYAVSELSAA